MIKNEEAKRKQRMVLSHSDDNMAKQQQLYQDYGSEDEDGLGDEDDDEYGQEDHEV